ncbi:MAG: hypothetical protein M3Q08_03575 [Pseudomonadota bacterium]|nr:hypothetical protein [Pseudomonadota bacterium]
MPPFYESRGQVRSMPLPKNGGGNSGAVAQATGDLGQAGQRAASDYQRVSQAELDSAARVREAQLDSAARVEQIERERRQQAQTADLTVAAIELEDEIRRNEAATFEQMPLGGEGVEEAQKRFRDERAEALLANVTDPEVYQRIAPIVARIKAGGGERTRDAVFRARGDKAVLGYEKVRESRVNLARTDLGVPMEEVLQPLREYLKTQPLTEAQRLKFETVAEQDAWIARTQGGIDSNPQGMLEILTSGKLDNILTSEQRQQLIGQAESAVNRQRVEAERAQAQAERAQREDEDEALTAARAGIQIDPSQLASLAAQAEARGDKSKALELRQAATSSLVTNAFQNATPEQITGQLAKIEGTADWQQNPDLVFQHKALTTLRDKRRNTPANIAPPQWHDPRSIQNYVRAVEADAAERGQPPVYLNEDMLRDYRAQMAKGPQGRAAVLDQLTLMGADRAFAAAQQLAPQDRVFRGAATLDRPARLLALSGAEALATNEKLAPNAALVTRFKNIGGRALSRFGGDAERSVIETARAITAEMLRQQGKVSWDPDVADEAIHMAAGGRMRGNERIGGFGKWNGEKIVLPDNMSQRQFEAHLTSRTGPANAYAGGKQLTYEQIRKHYRIVNTEGDGLYHALDAYDRPVMAKDGTPALIDIRQWQPRPRAAPTRREPARARSAYEARPQSSGGTPRARSAYEGLPR